MADRTNTDLQELRKRAAEPIAIIGMGCRLPGAANTPEAFWKVLHDGVDTIEEVPADRWNVAEFYSPDPDEPGKAYIRSGGFIKDVDLFDPQFFGITPKEANTMDPQQRLLLEVTWEALENAGQSAEELSGSRTAVFIGMCGNDYSQIMLSAGHDRLTGYMASGSAHSIAAGRLSYFLGLQGPCLTVDTACSSSLAAVQMGFQSLKRRECNLAIVGGVNLVLSPELMIVFSKMRMLAPDGRCKTFDASANGYTRSDGCGIVILKRQSDALRDGDHIRALIRGGAVNQDGRSSGLTVPNGASQQALIREALVNSGVEPGQVTYIETHGTGTPFGDPVEVNAIGSVFCTTHDANYPVSLGAVKANLGHLEKGARVAALIKTVLVLEHREILPNIHFKTPNPHIPWAELPIDVPTKPTPWSPKGGTCIAGISAFGFSGTNVHLIVQEAPVPVEISGDPERPMHVLPLSAKSEAALRELAGRFSRYLDASADPLPDVCFTASAGRSHFLHRVAIVAGSTEDLKAKLTAFSDGKEVAGTRRGTVSASARHKTAFLFTGQGSQYRDMGRRLYETEPVFRRTLQECDALLKPVMAESILSLLYGGVGATASLDQTLFTQPVLFSFEYALAQMWMSWGIQPSAVMGHSLGEYVAACVSGVFPLADGLQLIVERGRLMQSIDRRGEMIAVSATESQVTAFISPYSSTVSIAALNGPGNIVLSGPVDDVTAIGSQLKSAGVRVQRLQVQTAFHSPLMDPILDAFERAAQRISYSPARIPLVSNVTGRTIGSNEILDAPYWRLHLRSPVRFDSGVQALMEKGCSSFLELGPGTTLLGMARKCLPEGNYVWLPSLRSNRDDWEQVLESVATFYVRGVPIDWKAFDRGRSRSKVELPNYPFERSRCWFEEKGATARVRNAQSRPDVPVKPLTDNEWRDWLYDVQWVRAGEPSKGDSTGNEPLTTVNSAKWLILADGAGVGLRLAQLLTAKGERVELLEGPPSVAALREAVRLWATGNCQGIVHLWTLDAGEGSDLSLSNLEQAQNLTCETLLNILQALLGRKPPSPKIWAVTAGAQRISPTDSLSPAQALTWGFGRTIVLEYPELWGGLIDLDRDASADTQARLILEEIRRPGSEDQVALRKDGRYVPRMVRAAAGALSAPALSIKPDSTYVITGGMGRLGLKVAQWFVDLGAKHLVLTGRRGMANASPAVVAAIEAMRASGVEVEALAVDTGDETQMRSLTGRLRRARPLAGIIAAAGAFSRAPLDSTEFDSFAPMFRSKVAGTWLLNEMAQELDPDIFVLFSSITSLLGTRHLAHYAAACQFQDAFAAYRRRSGKHALAINWGMWDETGGDMESENAFRQSGNRPMESADALSALNYLLSTGETQKTVASIDWTILKPLYETRKRKPFLERIEIAHAPSGRSGLRSRFEAARPEDRNAVVEETVIGAVARVLGMQERSVPRELKFTEMGMDSLMASDMRNSLQSEAGVALPNTLSYDYPTIGDLSDYLKARLESSLQSAEDASAAHIDRVLRTVQRSAFPLSLPQENFWYLYRDNVAFNVPLPYRLKGRLNLPALESVLAEIVRRHEAVRTTFDTEKGMPVQIVSGDVRVELVQEDLSDLPEKQREMELQRLVARHSETTFDLNTGPLLKAWLLKAGDEDCVLLFVAHHMIFDAWSMKVLMRELEALYSAFVSEQPSPLPSLEIQYVDFAEWQRTRPGIEDPLAYWRQQFGGTLPRLPFPNMESSDEPEVSRGEKCRDILPSALVDRLKQAGGEANQTLFTSMFTAFGTLIHHYSAQDDIVLLSAGAGRTMRETEGLIGMFAAPLLVRANFSSDPPFSELLEQVRASFMGALSHPLPVQRLMESFGMNEQKGSGVLSQVFFDSLPDIPAIQLKGLENAAYFPTDRERMRHDLELYIRYVPAGMYCALWCKRGLFGPSIPRRMMDDFTVLLGRIADRPDDRISALLRGIPAKLVWEEKLEGALEQ